MSITATELKANLSKYLLLAASEDILRFAAMEKFDGFITAKSAADIHYLTHRCTHSEEESRVKLNKLLAIIGLLDTTAEDVFHALSSNVSDFEDAIMLETGIRCNVDCIVTRNTM